MLRIQRAQSLGEFWGGLDIRHPELARQGHTTICVKPPTDIVELAAVLHEQGHCAFKHFRHKGITEKEILLQEAQAWAYALRCVKPKFRRAVLDVCAWAMACYIRGSIVRVMDEHGLLAAVSIDPVETFLGWMDTIQRAEVIVE